MNRQLLRKRTNKIFLCMKFSSDGRKIFTSFFKCPFLYEKGQILNPLLTCWIQSYLLLPSVQSLVRLHGSAGWKLAGQFQVFILISLKSIMDSSKNGMWTSLFKTFSRLRVIAVIQPPYPKPFSDV